MRVSRLYVDQALSSGEELALDDRATRYVSQALRLRKGQSLVLFNGDGRDLHAEVLACGRRHCRVRIGATVAVEPPPTLQIHLGIGISRGERMDYAIQKSVELGVTALSPLITERGVVQLTAERAAQRLAHWRGVVTAACEQSGRNRLPGIHAPQPLADWIHSKPGGLLLSPVARQTLAGLAAPSEPITLLVGPEGGLSESEHALADTLGYTAVRLGPRVLRTETAPLAALAAMQALWGDFR